MIVWYSRECSSCFGNSALSKIEQVCKQRDIEFQERRTILWDRWEKEANEIMEVNEGLKLPFFYETASGMTYQANSLTPLDILERWVDNCIKEQNAG